MPTTLKLTSGQQRVMDAIKHLSARLGYSPSMREIASKLECTIPAVREMLIKLQRKGLISRVSGIPRSIRIK